MRRSFRRFLLNDTAVADENLHLVFARPTLDRFADDFRGVRALNRNDATGGSRFDFNARFDRRLRRFNRFRRSGFRSRSRFGRFRRSGFRGRSRLDRFRRSGFRSRSRLDRLRGVGGAFDRLQVFEVDSFVGFGGGLFGAFAEVNSAFFRRGTRRLVRIDERLHLFESFFAHLNQRLTHFFEERRRRTREQTVRVRVVTHVVIGAFRFDHRERLLRGRRIDVKQIENREFRFFFFRFENVENVENHLMFFRTSDDDQLAGRIVAVHVDVAALLVENRVKRRRNRRVFDRIGLHIRFRVGEAALANLVD